MAPTQHTVPDLRHAAGLISECYLEYLSRFREITLSARDAFERRDWKQAQRDAVHRLDLYRTLVTRAVSDLRQTLADRTSDRQLWSRLKDAYASGLPDLPATELAETFFNSITRRVFSTVGVNQRIEFTKPAPEALQEPPPKPAYRSIERLGRLEDLLRTILSELPLEREFADLELDVELVTHRIETERKRLGLGAIEAVDVLPALFYRGQRAYVIGRARRDDDTMPLVLALGSGEEGIYVDAVLLQEDDVSILFSFTRSYFHADIREPRAVVDFLSAIMPLKPVGELYNGIGFNKHGKTQFYRDLIYHLNHTEDQFQIAPGERGMVMVVFAMPSYDVVFKVIRDRFAYPKATTRADVMKKYDFVFKHDRAGRLLDIHEFEHLAFPRRLFSEQLLTALEEEAPSGIDISDSQVSIKHLYTERRTEPLNIYLKGASTEDARHAVFDYGRAIKDLAATNVFPGDLLLKNFGVTRHGRIVFYDYDEICPLTECTFRDLPEPTGVEEDMSEEPWFYVGPTDIFPEEFINFLGLSGNLRRHFLEHHSDLLEARFWRSIKESLESGEVIHVLPYREDQRLDRGTK